MVEALKTIGEHVFKFISTSDVSRGGQTVGNLPHPQFTLDTEGYENALGYYGSVATLMHNLNRIIKTDSLNDYAEGVTKGHKRDTLITARGYSGNEKDGYLFKGFSKGLGARRVSDEATYHLNKAKDKKLSPVDQLKHLELAKLAIARKMAPPADEKDASK